MQKEILKRFENKIENILNYTECSLILLKR